LYATEIKDAVHFKQYCYKCAYENSKLGQMTGQSSPELIKVVDW